MELSERQKKYFRWLSPSERRACIRDQERELSNAEALPESKARRIKVAELQARLQFLRSLR